MAGSSIIDTSGSKPSLRLAALTSTAVGTVIYGYVLGWLDFVGSAGSGFAETLDALGEFLGGGLVEGLFGLGETALDTAGSTNADFVGGLGLFGQVVAVVEVIVLILGIGWIVTTALRAAGWGLS